MYLFKTFDISLFHKNFIYISLFYEEQIKSRGFPSKKKIKMREALNNNQIYSFFWKAILLFDCFKLRMQACIIFITGLLKYAAFLFLFCCNSREKKKSNWQANDATAFYKNNVWPRKLKKASYWTNMAKQQTIIWY